MVDLHPGYGESAEQVHQLLQLCLFAAEWPLLVDAQDTLITIPKAILKGFAVEFHQAEPT